MMIYDSRVFSIWKEVANGLRDLIQSISSITSKDRSRRYGVSITKMAESSPIGILQHNVRHTLL